jgi:hypothetical protein
MGVRVDLHLCTDFGLADSTTAVKQWECSGPRIHTWVQQRSCTGQSAQVTEIPKFHEADELIVDLAATWAGDFDTKTLTVAQHIFTTIRSHIFIHRSIRLLTMPTSLSL